MTRSAPVRPLRSFFRLALLSSAALALSAGGGARAADGAQAPQADAPAEEQGIADIVVTAQRREEKLQQTPLSVSVLSADTIESQDVSNIERIEQVAPGIRVGRSGADARPSIRGITTENISGNGDPRIGYYLDDIYQSRTSETPPLVDQDRVEVQLGPQGTLYGRNSYGGNIAVYSAPPKDVFSAGINTLYGSYNRSRTEGFVNTPLMDGVSLRVAGMYERADGYVKNDGGGRDLDDTDQYFVRGTLKIDPPTVPGLDIVLRGSYWDAGGTGDGGFGYKQVGTLVDPSLIRAPGGSITAGGRTFTFPHGYNGSSFSGQVFPIDTRFRDGKPDVGGADVGVALNPDPYAVSYNSSDKLAIAHQQFSAAVQYDAGPVRLRSITSYTHYHVLRGADGDATTANESYAYFEDTGRTYTQEAQVLSNDADSPFQWIGGFYYYNDDLFEDSPTNQNRDYSTALALATGQPALYNFSFNYLPQPGDYITRYRSDSDSLLEQKTISYAGYGQASYTVLDALRFTLGYRYTIDQKDYAATFFNQSPIARPGSGVPGYYVYGTGHPDSFPCNGTTAASPQSNAVNYQTALINRCGSQEFDYSTVHGAIDYKITPDNFVYGSISTGVHSGGFNNTVNPLTNSLLAFGPEHVTAYEIGSKNEFLNHTLQLNADGFYNDYTHLQAQTSIPNPIGVGTLALVENIERARTLGADLQAIAKPAQIPHLTLTSSVEYLDSQELEYAVNTFSYGFCGIVAGGCKGFPAATLGVQGTPFPNPATNPDRFVPVLDGSGKQVVVGGVPQYNYVVAGNANGRHYSSPFALQPKWSVRVGAEYDYEIEGFGIITPGFETYFNSGYILTDLSPSNGRQKSYTKTDLRVSFLSPSGHFTGQVFVENLENVAVINRVAYSSNRSLSGSYATPQFWGVRVGYKF